MKYYANTVTKFTLRICAGNPDAMPQSVAMEDLFRKEGFLKGVPLPPYLLWMMRELQTFDDEREIGSWMGWVARSMEVLGFFTNHECRDLMCSDKDSPQWPRFLMQIGDARWFLPLREAGSAYDYDSSWVEVKIVGDVLDRNGAIRPITEEEERQIREAAEEYSASK